MTLDVGAGGFVCHAAEDGIRAAGNSAVHVVVGAGGDVDIAAGAVGIRSEGTALVEIAGDHAGSPAMRTRSAPTATPTS